MAFMLRSVAAARSAAAVSVARPAAASALRFAPAAAVPSLTSSFAALRFSSSSAGESSSAAAAAFSAPAARAPRPSFDFSGVSHLIPTKAHEEDPDAWWRKTDMALDRNAGKPGNQYTGRSYPVKGNYAAAFGRMSGVLSKTGTRAELRRAEYYERPSERKRRLRSERWRRRFQEEVRQRVQIVQMLRSRK